LLDAAKNLHHPKNKFEALMLLSAAEFLYYSRHYSLAMEVGRRLLQSEKEIALLGSSERNEVEALIKRCSRQLSDPSAKDIPV
jgi:hypothetical protein